MATTKISSNVLASNAAQDNLNAQDSISLTKAVSLSRATFANSTLGTESGVTISGTATTGKILAVSGTATTGTILAVSGTAAGFGSIFTAYTAGGVGFRIGETGQMFASHTASFSGGPVSISLGGNNNTNVIRSSNATAAATSTDIVLQGGTVDRTAGNLFQVRNNTNAVLTISAAAGTGNVGIGTTSPANALHVASSSGIRIDAGSPTGALNVGADVNATTRTSNVRKLASFVAPEYTNARSIEFFNFDSGSSSSATVSFGGRSGGSQYAATELNFLTAANTSTTGGTVAMTIDSSQRVGIGTTSPQQRLHVVSSTNNSFDGLTLRPLNNTVSFNIGWNGIETNNALRFRTTTAQSISFETNGQTNRMLINSSGDVGINNGSPSAKLHTIATTEQLRLGYDASNYASTTVSSAGLVTFDAVGASAGFAFSDPVTATAQPAIGALTDNDVMTRLLAAFESVINGNEFRQMTMTSSQQAGTGSSGATNGVLGMGASVTAALSGSASAYTFDNVNTHAGFSGAIMRSNLLTDVFFHGCMFRVEANINFVLRINFGVGAPTRVPPAAGVDAASARQWGVEFYYDGTNYVGRMYWYDTSMNYGTPFTIPNLTAANWTGMVYSMRMKQTSTGLLEFYINSPTIGVRGGRLSDTPTASIQATWTSNFYGGRHINFEAANGTAAAGTNTRIHCSTMFCRIG
jgi:hypothetical protein